MAGKTCVMTVAIDQLLHEINELLAPIESEQIAQFAEPQYPVVFLLGAPRCGHTLLSQLLGASKGFAYVSNFVARFWMAPYLGAKMELALGIREQELEQTYLSEHGRVAGWANPHEFGHFLRRWLPFDTTHNVGSQQLSKETANKFAKEVAALEHVYGKPVFLRNLIYGLNIDWLSKVFPQAIFVVCRRNPLYQAQSILIARQKVLDNKESWWSLRPKAYPSLVDLPYWEQIVGQIYYTYQEIDASLAKIDQSQWLDINYADVCKQPHKQVEKIVIAVERLGGTVSWKPEVIPQSFESSDTQRLSNKEFQKLSCAIRKFFNLDNRSD